MTNYQSRSLNRFISHVRPLKRLLTNNQARIMPFIFNSGQAQAQQNLFSLLDVMIDTYQVHVFFFYRTRFSYVIKNQVLYAQYDGEQLYVKFMQQNTLQEAVKSGQRCVLAILQTVILSVEVVTSLKQLLLYFSNATSVPKFQIPVFYHFSPTCRIQRKGNSLRPAGEFYNGKNV